MSWDFIVPVCLDDLVKSGAVNQYVVQDVLPAKQLPPHIKSKSWTLFNCIYLSIAYLVCTGVPNVTVFCLLLRF